jgi:hypothetical protein
MKAVSLGVRQYQSRAAEAAQAVREFHSGVDQPDMALVVFFCSPRYDLQAIAAEMRRMFAGVTVIGCITAGEIGSHGYCACSLAGASFSSRHFRVAAGCLEDLQHFSIARGQSFAQSLLRQLDGGRVATDFALMLIDGLSIREEPVAHAFQHALGNIPLLGGSAADEKTSGKSYVYFNGEFRSDSAVLAVVDTDLPFVHFKSQHFTASDTRLVVTRADAARRIVYEVNGLPAAEEYARLVGVQADDLSPLRFASAPLVMKINGIDYVRSIQKANPDGSLTFYCAIDEGLVLRLAHGVDMVGALERAMAGVHRQLGGAPQIVLGMDCVLRSIEYEQAGVQGQIADIYRDNRLVGFRCYGEQYQGIHVNQTLTALAIGLQQEKAHD